MGTWTEDSFTEFDEMYKTLASDLYEAWLPYKNLCNEIDAQLKAGYIKHYGSSSFITEAAAFDFYALDHEECLPRAIFKYAGYDSDEYDTMPVSILWEDDPLAYLRERLAKLKKSNKEALEEFALKNKENVEKAELAQLAILKAKYE